MKRNQSTNGKNVMTTLAQYAKIGEAVSFPSIITQCLTQVEEVIGKVEVQEIVQQNPLYKPSWITFTHGTQKQRGTIRVSERCLNTRSRRIRVDLTFLPTAGHGGRYDQAAHTIIKYARSDKSDVVYSSEQRKKMPEMISGIELIQENYASNQAYAAKQRDLNQVFTDSLMEHDFRPFAGSDHLRHIKGARLEVHSNATATLQVQSDDAKLLADIRDMIEKRLAQ